MKAGSTLLLSTLLATSAIASRSRGRAGFTKRAYTPPPGSPGFYHGNSTAAVTFDNLSAFVDNKRVFVFSGEFHPWRLPSGTGAWRDVLQKMKVCRRPSIPSIHLLPSISSAFYRQPGSMVTKFLEVTTKNTDRSYLSLQLSPFTCTGVYPRANKAH
jgi:hypothetical protein